MSLSKQQIIELINEELTKTDKSEIKTMINKALDKEVAKAVKDELEKAMKSTDLKSDIGDIAKKVIKKLYKDLSFHHPYIIDRIKV
tara:strand:+ start:6559 stop:6816 length:258 start_codon:yes stop_codon:yes gene_type:complete